MEECSQFLKNEFSDRFWVPFALCGCGIQHRVSSPCFPPKSRRVLATGRPRDRLLAVSPPKKSTSPITVRLRDASELPRKRPKTAQKLRTPMGECSQFFKNDFSERFWVRFALCGIRHRAYSPCFRPRSRRVLVTGRPRGRLLAVSPPKKSMSPEHRSPERRVTRR